MYTPRELQALIKDVLKVDLNKFASVHVDDILVFHKTILIMHFMLATSLYTLLKRSLMWKWRNSSSVKVNLTSHHSVWLKQWHESIVETQQTKTVPGHGHGPPKCLFGPDCDSFKVCNCGIALISLPPCRDKVPSSVTTNGESHFFAEEERLFFQ